MTPDPVALQCLLDEQAIRDLAARYCWALDTGDDALLADVFLPDATANLGSELVGFEQIRRRIRDVLGPLDASQHVIGSHDVQVDGDEARSRCYFIAQHVRHDAADGPHYVVAGIYADRCVRTPAGWRIARRDLRPLWTEGNVEVVRGGRRTRRAERRPATDTPGVPSDEALWRSVEQTIRKVIVPALPDGYARTAAVQLAALAAHARTRPPSPERVRTVELASALDSLATNPVVAPHWPRCDRSRATVAEACGRALADALERDDMAAGEVRQRLRPLLLGHLDEDLSRTSALLPAFRGRLP